MAGMAQKWGCGRTELVLLRLPIPKLGVHSFELYPSVASVKGSLLFAYANRPGRSASVVETLEEVRTRCDAVRLFWCYLTTKTHESDRVR